MQPGLGKSALRAALHGNELPHVTPDGAVEVAAAISSAYSARGSLASASRERRMAVLAAVASSLGREREAFAQLIMREVDKPIDLARAEVDRAICTFSDAAAVTATHEGRLVPLDTVPQGAGREALVRRVPIGVVAAITPFNFPLNLVAHKVAPGLASGCPVLLKPSPDAQRTALALGDLIADAAESCGLPTECLSVLAVTDDSLAAPLVESDLIRGLSFTGSESVGWALRDRARGKSVALELGGDAFVVIGPDAPIRRAAERVAIGAFSYAGQTCIAVQHVLVHASVREQFEAELCAITRRVITGRPDQSGVLLGPVLRERDADRLEAWLLESLRLGARVVAEGTIDASMVSGDKSQARRRVGRWLAPLVLTDVPINSNLGSSEAFGPYVDLASYEDVDGVVARLAQSRFGLQLGVFTSDLRTIRALYDQVEVGAVVVGDIPTFRLDPMTYGGVKRSGLGREGARDAMDWYTEPRVLVW